MERLRSVTSADGYESVGRRRPAPTRRSRVIAIILVLAVLLEFVLLYGLASVLLDYEPQVPEWLRYTGTIAARSSPAMLVDAFPYSHEYLLLDMRLRMLAPVADYHIMIEAAFDQRGRPRKLYAGTDEMSAEVLREFEEKMVRVELKQPPKEVPFYRRKTYPLLTPRVNGSPVPQLDWSYEFAIRDSIGVKGFPKLPRAPRDSDLIFISDCDELPNPEVLDWFRHHDFPLLGNMWIARILPRISTFGFFWEFPERQGFIVALTTFGWLRARDNRTQILRDHLRSPLFAQEGTQRARDNGMSEATSILTVAPGFSSSFVAMWHCSVCSVIADYRIKLRHVLEVEEGIRRSPKWSSLEWAYELRQRGSDLHNTSLIGPIRPRQWSFHRPHRDMRAPPYALERWERYKELLQFDMEPEELIKRHPALPLD